MSSSIRAPLPPGIPATRTRVEQEILKAIDEASEAKERKVALWRLALFYHEQAKRSDLAGAVLQLMIQEFDGPENTAVVYYALGRIAQADEKWAVALEQYEKGLLELPKQPDTLYFLRNNAGFCLNALGRFSEGERYCRWSLEINSSRPNAFKNLGISLYGQGNLRGAAWCWLEALNVDPDYLQARKLLNELLIEHPTIQAQCAWIQQQLQFKKTLKLN
jgi:tetratricopeptide (TPR) repeat protein